MGTSIRNVDSAFNYLKEGHEIYQLSDIHVSDLPDYESAYQNKLLKVIEENPLNQTNIQMDTSPQTDPFYIKYQYKILYSLLALEISFAIYYCTRPFFKGKEEVKIIYQECLSAPTSYYHYTENIFGWMNGRAYYNGKSVAFMGFSFSPSSIHHASIVFGLFKTSILLGGVACTFHLAPLYERDLFTITFSVDNNERD